MNINSIKGKLTIKVKDANLTHDTELFAKMSPYVVIQCGGVQYQTTVQVEAGKTPKWN